MAAKITTLSPELITEIRRVIDQVNRQSRNQIKDSPREVPKAPDDYVVLTPETGIPARTSTRINAVICNVYREEEIVPGVWGGQKGLVAITDGYGNPYQLPIYNIYCESVPGNLLVPTALLKSGTRYVTNWFECESSSSDSSSDSSDSSPSDSSSSDSASSSDDRCPCDGTCVYLARYSEGGGLVWVRVAGTCDAPCYCETPSYEPSYYEEVANGTCWGPCESSSDESSSDSTSDSSDESASDSDSQPSSDSGSDSDSGSSSDSSSDSESGDGDYTCDGVCEVIWTGTEWTQAGQLYTCEPSDGVGICGCASPGGDGDYIGQVVTGTCAKF